MKRMFVLSVIFHLVLGGLMIGLSSKRADHPMTALYVDLVSLPQPVQRKSRPKSVARPVQPLPKPVVKKKESPKKPKIESVVKKEIQPKLKKPEKIGTIIPPDRPKKEVEALLKPEDEPEPTESTPPGPSESDLAAVASPSVSSVVAGVDIPEFEFPFYLKLIQGKIGSLWSPPALQVRGDTHEVIISFVLATTGKVHDIRVEKSSGNIYYDQAALRAVFISNPMPPLPKGFSDPNLKVHFSFVLGENG